MMSIISIILVTVTATVEKSCTLECGTVVADGWTGKGEKNNHCNDCKCNNGLVACTRMMCSDKPCDTPVPVPASCTLECGTIVADGWTGKGEKRNHCNDCKCNNGLVACTRMMCSDKPCDAPVPVPASCTLECGTIVADGWTGKGEKRNHCNDCKCNNGKVACTRMMCSDKPCLPCVSP